MGPKCSNLNFIGLQHVFGSDDPWFCFKSNSDILPFGKLNNQNFKSFVIFFTEASSNAKHNQESSTLLLKPPPNVSLLFNQFNDLLAESNRANRKNVINCNNYDIDYIQKIKTNSSSHLNTCSLNENFDDLEYLLKTRNQTFRMIAISEPRIFKNQKITKY